MKYELRYNSFLPTVNRNIMFYLKKKCYQIGDAQKLCHNVDNILLTLIVVLLTPLKLQKISSHSSGAFPLINRNQMLD